jgi:hypothetical protein
MRTVCFLAVVIASMGASAASADDGQAHPQPTDDGVLAALELGTFRVDSASPMGRRLGVGLEVGWPTAVTAKLMLRPQHAVRVSLGAFSGLALTEPSLSLTADWLYHPSTLAKNPAWTLSTHVGAGASVVVLPIVGKRTTIPALLYHRAPTQLWAGVRVPVGVDLAFRDIPVDIVLDVVPTILAYPGLGVGVGASIGARWWW